jgi:AGZA family xanthine/uracil permease-like MFS transporter
VAFAYLPSVARLLAIKLASPSIVPVERFRALLTTPGKELPEALVTVALGNGFILTAMLWGAFLAEMIDRRLRRSALYLAILAVCTFFGVVHSSSPDGNVYLPWKLTGALERTVPYQFALGYLALAGLVLLLSMTRESREPAPADLGHTG